MSERRSELAGPRPAAGMKLPLFATSIDVDLAELTGAGNGRVVVLALILPGPAAEHGPGPMEVGRHRPTVTPVPERERHPIEWLDLTERERAVAYLAGRALTNQQIANRLGISAHTVNFHLRHIFRKLGIASRVHLARIPADRSDVVADVRPLRSG